MLTMLKGDDTAANNKTIQLRLPDTEIGTSFFIGFELFGIVKKGEYTPGGVLKFDYTRDQTSRFPLGVSYGRTFLEKDGLMQTINNTIPVCVTDCVERVTGQTNDMNLSVTINTPVPHVDKEALTKDATRWDIKDVVNAVLAAINSGNDAQN